MRQIIDRGSAGALKDCRSANQQQALAPLVEKCYGGVNLRP